jgi:hypothetical protein
MIYWLAMMTRMTCVYKSVQCLWKLPTCEIDPNLKELSPECIPCPCIPVALSLASDKRIIVTTTEKKVMFYDRQSQFEVLHLPDDIGEPQHVIEYPNIPDRYLLLQTLEPDGEGSVLVLEKRGDKLIEIGQIKCHTPQCDGKSCDFSICDHYNCYLNSPRHMAHLSDDSILVADYKNNRVVVLNLEKGGFVPLVAHSTDNRVQRPCRLAYYADHHILLVAMRVEGFIYKL